MSHVKKKIDICFHKNTSIVINIDEYSKSYTKMKGRGGKIRLPPKIKGENLNYWKQLTALVDELQYIIEINGSVMNNGSLQF